MRLAIAFALATALAGCARGVPRSDAGWFAVDGVPLVRQADEKDCGEAALAMVLAHWGVEAAAAPDEASAAELKELALARGLHAFVIAGEVRDLEEHLAKGRPLLAGVVRKNGLTHWEVVTGIHPAKRAVATLDPARGPRTRSLDAFLREWTRSDRVLLVTFPR